MELIKSLKKLDVYVCTMADIVKLANSNRVYKKQRPHELRVADAKHVHRELSGNKRMFTAVLLDGEMTLIDGYTRTEAFKRKLVTEAGEVLLHVHHCSTQAEVELRYDQMDNPVAAKKGRDRVYEGLRSEGVQSGDLSSILIKKGPLPSAVSSATGLQDKRRAAAKVVKGILAVDKLGLSNNRTTVSAGVLAAFLAIATHDPEKSHVRYFIKDVHAPAFEAQSPAEDIVAELRDAIVVRKQRRSCSGTANVDEMRDMVLEAFVRYKQALCGGKPSRATRKSLTLGSFEQLYR